MENIIFDTSEIQLSEILATYFNETAIQLPPNRVYRIDKTDERWYYTIDKELNPTFFMSVTAWTSKYVKDRADIGIGLWREKVGTEVANERLYDRSCYGTFMHIKLGLLLQFRKIENYYAELQQYMLDCGIIKSTNTEAERKLINKWNRDLYFDLLCYKDWIIKYDVKPIFIEGGLVSLSDRLAGSLDLVCEMYDKEYDKTPIEKRKKVRAIIDFKSGKNGFTDKHIMQLYEYKSIWLENFPNYPIDIVGNVAPTDWQKRKDKKPKCKFEVHSELRTKPTNVDSMVYGEDGRPILDETGHYVLVGETKEESYNLYEVQRKNYVANYLAEREEFDKNYIKIDNDGVIDLDSTESDFSIIDLQELIIAKHQNLVDVEKEVSEIETEQNLFTTIE